MVFATMPNLVDDACTAFPRKRASRAAILMKNFDPTDFATVYITLSLPCGSKTGRIPTRYGATYFSQWRKCSANGLRLNCILCYVPAKYFPSDYYWDDETSKWRRLAELPCGKSVLATPAQRQMLTNRGLPWDEFTTKYQVQELIESRPCTDKQRAFMDDLGITHFDGMTTREASDLIDAELAKETPDGPATP